METMRNVLRTADDQEMARKGVDTLMTAFKDHVLSFVDDLPGGTLSAEYFVTAENQFGMSEASEVVVVAPSARRGR